MEYEVRSYDSTEWDDALAQDMGYESAAGLRAEVKAEEEKLDPEVRAAAADYRRDMLRRLWSNS